MIFENKKVADPQHSNKIMIFENKKLHILETLIKCGFLKTTKKLHLPNKLIKL